MLRVNSAQRRRLEEIIRNLTDRIDEARANGRLGEVQGIHVSAEAARNKLATLDRLARNRFSTPVDLGMPRTCPANGEAKPLCTVRLGSADRNNEGVGTK